MKQQLTVAQSLRHARHDFLNDLQLIGMNLDMDRVQEAKRVIRSHAETAVQWSRLAALRMPEMEEWLLTAKWRFPEVDFGMECPAHKGAVRLDAAFADWLENFTTEAIRAIEQEEKISCRIRITEDEEHFQLAISLEGEWNKLKLPEIQGLLARKECADGSLTVIVSTQMEG